MTKDRRLGKGLAALLGSPLDGETPASPPSSTAGSEPPATPATGPTSAAQGTSHAVRKVPLNRDEEASAAPGQPAVPETTATPSPQVSPTLHLSVYEIDNNPFQPRRKFNEEEIESLAQSIREHEQLQPILVRQVGQRYQLISGERRLRATIHAGLTTIRAEVREADDRLVAELAIVENLQRKDLDAIEKALSFRRYIDEHQCTQDGLAKRLKIDRSTIANLMRLLELPEEIQQSIQSERLTAGHARALLPLGDEDQQLDFARRIQSEGWNVRETERRVSGQLDTEDGVARVPAGRSTRKRTSPQIAALEQQLRLSLGTKTEIRQNANGRGKITISFANPDEFERICQLLQPSVSRNAA